MEDQDAEIVIAIVTKNSNCVRASVVEEAKMSISRLSQ